MRFIDGDIGVEGEEIELEPVTVPIHVPVPTKEPIPA